MGNRGQIYEWIAQAVARRGGARSVYSQDTTLSWRGLLTRADKRAAELRSMGIGLGELVLVSMGNVVDFLVLLIAVNKLGAIGMPVDPAQGEKTILQVTERLPVRAVVRRPRGAEQEPLAYGPAYKVRMCKRLSGSLLTIDVLDPTLPQKSLPPGTEIIVETRTVGGAPLDILRTREHLRAIGEVAKSALRATPDTRLLSSQSLTIPQYFDTVVLAWFTSGSQLAMAEGSPTEIIHALDQNSEDVVMVDCLSQFNRLARALKASGAKVALRPAFTELCVQAKDLKAMRSTLTGEPMQLLVLEEAGVLAYRSLERGEPFTPCHGVEFAASPKQESDGGHELLVRLPQAYQTLPAVSPPMPWAKLESEDPAYADFRHTGYVGKFGSHGELLEILHRNDGLAHIDGRRICLDNIESVLLEHRRLTWARAFLLYTSEGEPEIAFEYCATGKTGLDDLEEFAVGRLPPYMVPRRFTRRASPT